MSFGNNLKDARKKLGITQDELAAGLDVTRQSVSKWETGEGYPETEKLIQMTHILNVSLDELFDEEINSGELLVTNNLHKKKIGAER